LTTLTSAGGTGATGGRHVAVFAAGAAAAAPCVSEFEKMLLKSH